MATYVLIPGAGSDSWYWHLVTDELRERGHEVVTPELPSDDDTAGLSAYVDTIVAAIGGRRQLVLVAQSMGGLTAPIVCQRLPVDLLVLVAAMVPMPGETGQQWWENTGQPQAQRELDAQEGRPVDAPFDPMVTFFHDLPPELAAEAMTHGKEQSGTPFVEPSPLSQWPDVPTRFLLCRQDRLFPAPMLRRMVRQRLGIVPDELDSGHLPALSRPKELVARLEAYREELALP